MNKLLYDRKCHIAHCSERVYYFTSRASSPSLTPPAFCQITRTCWHILKDKDCHLSSHDDSPTPSSQLWIDAFIIVRADPHGKRSNCSGNVGSPMAWYILVGTALQHYCAFNHYFNRQTTYYFLDPWLQKRRLLRIRQIRFAHGIHGTSWNYLWVSTNCSKCFPLT